MNELITKKQYPIKMKKLITVLAVISFVLILLCEVSQNLFSYSYNFVSETYTVKFYFSGLGLAYTFFSVAPVALLAIYLCFLSRKDSRKFFAAVLGLIIVSCIASCVINIVAVLTDPIFEGNTGFLLSYSISVCTSNMIFVIPSLFALFAVLLRFAPKIWVIIAASIMLAMEIISSWSLIYNYTNYCFGKFVWHEMLNLLNCFGYILFFVTIILFAVGNKNLLSKKKMALLLAAEQELEDDEQEDESEDEEDCLYEEE